MKVDLRERWPEPLLGQFPHHEQGEYGNAVSCATAACVEYLMGQQRLDEILADESRKLEAYAKVCDWLIARADVDAGGCWISAEDWKSFTDAVKLCRNPEVEVPKLLAKRH
jgi:hypothetical protein